MNRKLFGKEEIKTYIAKKRGWTKTDVELFLKEFKEAIIENVAAGERVHLDGFGDFYTKIRKGGVGQNPKTGEKFAFPDEVKVKFIVAKDFRDAVNGR